MAPQNAAAYGEMTIDNNAATLTLTALNTPYLINTNWAAGTILAVITIAIRSLLVPLELMSRIVRFPYR